MNVSILIRPVGAKDREQWQELWRGYYTFYESDLSAGVDGLWQRLMAPNADGPFALVAVADGGKLVGLAQYLFHLTTWSEAPRCYLNDLYALPSARGLGAGRKLIEAVYAAADARGSSQVYWTTQLFNHEARLLYGRVGKLTSFIKYVR
jgi:GNAT superfamily N-acetyltransferase